MTTLAAPPAPSPGVPLGAPPGPALGEALTRRARDAQAKARVLREALPWITRWTGRTVVVKYGGNAMGDAAALASFAADVALLHRVGLRVVVVHGGGPQISALSERLGLSPAFVDGQRVTDEQTLDVVKMVLLGQVNPRIVGAITAEGVAALGVAGTDGTVLRARPLDPRLGHVGGIERCNPTILTMLLDEGAVPVVAPLARDADGGECNVNADVAAGAIATALRADKLLYLTNVPGLYEDFGAHAAGTAGAAGAAGGRNGGSGAAGGAATGADADTAAPGLLANVSLARLRALLDSGTLSAGMIPKVTSIVDALDGGVPHAHLLDGRVEHALLLEIFTDSGIGTKVTATGEEDA